MTITRPPYRRILITRLRFIGDVVLTTPIIRSVRAAFPGAYIAYLGEKNAVSLLEHNPCLDEIIPFDPSRSALFEQARVMLLLRRRKFDLAIDLFGNPRSALLTYASRAATRVGLQRRGRGRLYTVQVADDGAPKTALAFHNQFLAAAGIVPTESRTEIVVTEQEREEACRWLARGTGVEIDAGDQGPLVGIHPGATWPAKKWLPERFAELSDAIVSKLGGRVVVTAGPQDSGTVAEVLRQTRAKVNVLTALPLRTLAAVIAQCSVYVSNDAAPMHIAAAVGTPVIGLFGPGEENIWFPYPRAGGHAALRRDVPCHPCHLDRCNREGEEYMECMKLLRVEEVLSAVETSLQRKPSSL